MTDKIILIFLGVLVLALIILRIIRLIFKSYILNKITNILVYLVEIYIAGTLISLLLYKESFQSHTSFLIIFKDYVFANSIYQIFLGIILKFWDGTTIDALNSLQAPIKRIKLYSSNKEQLSKYFVLFKTETKKSKDDRSYNKYALSIIDNLTLVVDAYLNNNLSEREFNRCLDDYLISIEHEKNFISLGWQNSLLLRIFK